MSYSGDPSSSGLDAVRFWAQDTGNPGLLSDNEIEYLIAFSGLDPDLTPVDIAALAADRIAAKYAGMVSINADGVSYSGDQLYQKYQALAKELRQSAKTMQGWNAVPFAGASPLGMQFAVGMHDNPQAALQTQYLDPYGDDELQTVVNTDTGKVN
jgi:hypothetical protein